MITIMKEKSMVKTKTKSKPKICALGKKVQKKWVIDQLLDTIRLQCYHCIDKNTIPDSPIDLIIEAAKFVDYDFKALKN